MKRGFLIILLAFLAIESSGQLKKKYGDYVSPWFLGLRAGLTTPTYIGGSDLPHGGSKYPAIGLTMGLILNYNFSKKFSLYTELLFIQGGYQKKYQIQEPTNSTNYNEKALWGYVQIPILAKLRFGSDAFKFTVHGGPYLSFGTGGKLNLNSESNGNSKSTTINLDVQVNELAAIDFGAVLGTGLQIKAGTGVFITDFRVNLGFSDIYDKDAKYKATQNVIPSFSVGYLIPVGN